jgi:RNA polymerase sigma factor (sigma-70 family)
MRALQSLSDRELIECFHAGHERAFDVLFYRYGKDIRNVIVHYIKDRLLTEDLSQDAFLKIYTSLKRRKYNEEGKFLPWALRIARNLCMDHLRKASQLPALAHILHDDSLCNPQLSAENKLCAKQRDQHLNTFISRLPEDQKKVVYYRYFEDLSFKQIALLMDTNVNTSLGRMRYGLAHLRKQIKYTPSYVWR